MSMVEQMARAMLAAEARADVGYGDVWGWEDIMPQVRDRLLAAARAALAAQRTPTPGMVEAGEWPAEDDGAVACWKAMIDAALTEGEDNHADG